MISFNFLTDKCLPLYTEVRHEDAKAICDLALMNYVEVCQRSHMFYMHDLINIGYIFPHLSHVYL